MRLFHGCKHEWKFVKEWKEPDLSYDTPHFKYWAIVYCPLCGKVKRIAQSEWETISKIQKIKKQYDHTGPHLIDVTPSGLDYFGPRVYTLNVGVTQDDLTREEKRLFKLGNERLKHFREGEQYER